MTDSIYELLGGKEAIKALVEHFYTEMDENPRVAGIRQLHAESLTEAKTKLYLFLSGWLGGPDLYVEKFGHPRLRARHMPFPIGVEERDQWLLCMKHALEKIGYEEKLDRMQREWLWQTFANTANAMRNA